MDLEKLTDEQIRALASPWGPDGTPKSWQVLDPIGAERYIASRHGDDSSTCKCSHVRRAHKSADPMPCANPACGCGSFRPRTETAMATEARQGN